MYRLPDDLADFAGPADAGGVANPLDVIDNSTKKINKLRRMKERQKSHLETAEEARELGTTMLEASSVRKPTAKRYRWLWGAFLAWTTIAGLAVVLLQQVDVALVE